MLAGPQVASVTATQAHHLVRDLHTADARTYWTDMLLTAAVGWGAFAGAALFRLWSWPMLAAFAVSVFALYRGLCFLHEVSHLRSGALRGFDIAWNVVFGIPLLLPSFVYVGVHKFHHNLATYGTENDPEYIPFSGKPLLMLSFVAQCVIVPLMMIVRFIVLEPAALLAPSFHRVLCERFSALCLNLKFRREISVDTQRNMRRWEIVTLISWIALAAVVLELHVATRCLATWYAASACAAAINMSRTLGAHRYASDGRPLERDEQLLDSIDTPGAIWTELWAPVGLRYHALHHYFPGIPYHNLGKAHRRLTGSLPSDSVYRRSVSPGLPTSVGVLWRGKTL